MGFKSFQPSRIRVSDARQLQLQQNSKDGLLRATQAAAASRLRPHTQGLTSAPAANSANKLSKWQTASKGDLLNVLSPNQSQAASMLDFKLKLEMPMEDKNAEAGPTTAVSTWDLSTLWHSSAKLPCIQK